MTASKKTPSTVEQELGRELEQLQQSASIVADGQRSSNKALYKHFAELYMWWRSASTVDGYLDAAYATTGRKYKKKTTQGINFAPLFWLAWGHNNDLSNDKVGRWSRVLNALHKVYEEQKQYRTDSIPKLQNYIQNSGGVEGVAGYDKATDDEVDDDEADALLAPTPRIDVEPLLARLYAMAKDFYSAVPDPVTIDLDYTIPTSEDGMGLVLVRKIGDKYQLVGASSDETMVKPLAMHTYLHDFAALPHSIRTIVETISTQCLPERLQHFHDALIDSSAKSAGAGSRKSVRRLMYVHTRGDFVLSPLHADSGVVTMARPNKPVLANPTRDAFLSTRSRRAIERRLICGHDFNLYSPANDDVIPEYGPQINLASHAIRVQHQFAPTDYLHLDFWPFYESLPAPRGQLIAYPLQPGFGKWRASFSLAWFRKFALEFIAPWVRGHGKYIKRPHEKVLQLSFDKAALTLSYVRRGDAFEAEVTVGFGSTAASGKDISVHALTKDFVIAMQGVADLGVVSAIEVEVDADVVAMNFSTSSAGYKLYIPTCTPAGVRSAKHFTPYEPKPVAPDEDYYDDQQEGDFDEAR